MSHKNMFKWTHELEVDFWKVIDDKECNPSPEDIWCDMKYKDLVTLKQVTSHLRYVNKFKQQDGQSIQVPYENINGAYTLSCVDIETTGFGRNAQIISIALVSSCCEVDDYYCYIAPTKNISTGASKVNKLSTKKDKNGKLCLYKNKRPINTTERVKALREFVKILDTINRIEKDHYLLAHNGYIADFPWLFREFIKYEINYENTFEHILLCDTMKWVRNSIHLPEIVKNEDIYTYCYNKAFDAHDALADANATIAWVLHQRYCNYIEELKCDHSIHFTEYMENFLENEQVLTKKDIIDSRFECPTVMAYSTRKKIAVVHNAESIDNTIKSSEDIYEFHGNFKEDLNVKESTSVKVYKHFENINVTPKWICRHCNKRMREYTSKKEWSLGRKFYACFQHNEFNWIEECVSDKPIVHSLERYGIIWDIQEQGVQTWFIEKTLNGKTKTVYFDSKNKDIVYSMIEELYQKLKSTRDR